MDPGGGGGQEGWGGLHQVHWRVIKVLQLQHRRLRMFVRGAIADKTRAHRAAARRGGA